MGTEDVAITGVGCLTPYGRGPEDLFSGVISGRDAIKPVSRFDTTDYSSDLAGEIPILPGLTLGTPSTAQRNDRFTQLALAAAKDALKDAGIEVGVDVDTNRVALSMGNVLGGWEFAEQQLRLLYTYGAGSVSPYQATAWYPPAAQIEIAKQHRIEGPSRTFVVDRASSAYAYIEGLKILQHGVADVVLVGGAEAPVCPYGWLCLQTSGLVARHSRRSSSEAVYRPYDYRHVGSTFGEGAAFLVLERADFARARGAAIHGWARGWGRSSDGYMPYYTVEPAGEVYARAITDALRRSESSAGELGVAYLHGSGVPMEDVTELRAFGLSLGDHSQDVPVTVVKSLFGHLMGAAFLVDTVLALWSLKERVIPPIAHHDQLAPGMPQRINLATQKMTLPDQRSSALVTARGLGGSNAAAIVGV